MTNSGTDQLARRTVMVAVTTMEEVALPTEVEQEAMRASLKAVEADIEAGRFIEHDPNTFVDRLLALRDKAVITTRS